MTAHNVTFSWKEYTDITANNQTIRLTTLANRTKGSTKIIVQQAMPSP